jgi:hypothetical protein
MNGVLRTESVRRFFRREPRGLVLRYASRKIGFTKRLKN